MARGGLALLSVCKDNLARWPLWCPMFAVSGADDVCLRPLNLSSNHTVHECVVWKCYTTDFIYLWSLRVLKAWFCLVPPFRTRRISQLKAVERYCGARVNAVAQRASHDDLWINLICPYPCRGCIWHQQCCHSTLCFYVFSVSTMSIPLNQSYIIGKRFLAAA